MTLRKGVVSRRLFFLAAVLSVRGAAAQTALEPSERDYFQKLPEVLSVSRLAQPLDETPGAVTIIDRKTIRQSGARELYDVLKLVPGFVVARMDGANPLAAYHGDFDSLNRHLQIFVDGRSVYSGLYAGNVGSGSLGVVLEDVERIEVLRGSNSAAYGTDAYLGVINVVTSHTSDTLGTMVAAAQGGGGVADKVARLGWGDSQAAYRASFSHRQDAGVSNQFDDRKVVQFHLRGDLQLSSRDELLLAAGATETQGGVGTVGDDGDPPRTMVWKTSYLHSLWKRQLSGTDEVRFSGSFNEERSNETYGYYPAHSAGLGRRVDVQGQYAFAVNAQLRMVAGGQYRYQFVDSPDLFFDRGSQSSHFWQWFGNAEWRLHEQWLLNIGGLFEHHSITGSRTAPRVMINFHALPGHTLRAGTTTSYRVPTLFELRGDWRWTDYERRGITYRPLRFIQATGGVKPARLDAHEIGYLGEFRPLHLSVDVRCFRERDQSRMRNFGLDWTLAPGQQTNVSSNDIINKSPTLRRGWETQMRWRPLAATQLVFNHTVLKLWDTDNKNSDDKISAPSHFSSLMLMQRLPADFDLSATYSTAGQMTWIRRRDMLPASHQLDLRLAKRFHVGATRGEAAITAQAVDASYADYLPDRIFERRVFATVRLDF